jgi:hypothetical protein
MSHFKLIIAIALNLFVMPGAGQIYFKERKRGTIFSVLAVGLLMACVFHFTYMLKQQLASVQLTPGVDIVRLSETLSQSLWDKHENALRSYVFFLGTIYIASIVDVILIFMDRRKIATTNPPSYP